MHDNTIERASFENAFSTAQTDVEREFWRLRLRLRIQQVLKDPPFLFDSEVEFLENMIFWLKSADPSPKQLAWIDKILRRPKTPK